MKKILVSALFLALLCGLCGCGSFVSLMPGTLTEEEIRLAEEEESFQPQALFDFLGLEDFAQNYYNNTPVALSYAAGAEGASPRFDRESIIKACDALRGMTVTEPLAQPVEEDSRFVFTMADGSTHTVRFAGRDLASFLGDYALEGGENLWELSFPGYDEGFDIFDLYNSESMRAFADGFESDTPVSVGRRVNGGALLTSKDEAVVRRAFELLKNAGIDRVEASPDQNVNLNQTEEYIFTMADGFTVTFLFTGQCLTVRANEVYGDVYYWLTDMEELFYMDILPEDEGEAFAGGAVTGLREDIYRAAEAADGLLEDKTVIGVYVSYVIDGQEGIVTFQADDAAEFMRYLAGLQLTDEILEAEPEGEIITISVTLSDWSGPIFNFTGDAIQETIGTWYRCDSSSFEDLQAHILAEAEAQAEDEEEDEE